MLMGPAAGWMGACMHKSPMCDPTWSGRTEVNVHWYQLASAISRAKWPINNWKDRG